MSLGTSNIGCRGGRDERRRRLLIDERSGADDWPSGRVVGDTPAPSRKSQHYADAEFLRGQLRLLDFVPRQWAALTMLAAAIAASIAGLELAYASMAERTASGATAIAALQIDGKGSLACWLSSLLLLAASAAAMVVYSIRKHKTDDYQGRYRVWLWAAGGCLLMATDQAASLREAFRDLMVSLTGARLWGDGSLWWMAIYAFFGGAIGSRLVMDMRPSRFSIGTLIAAIGAYGLALADRLGWLFIEPGTHDVIFRTAAGMTGDGLLLAAMLSHARYVILDAEGILLHRRTHLQVMVEPEQAEPEATPVTVSATAPAVPAVSSKTASPISDRKVKIDPPHTMPPQADHKLSKAERRALKERLLSKRAEREGE